MKRRLNIAMFISSNTSNTGGVQEHVLLLSRELSNMKHTVNIFGPGSNKLHMKNYYHIGKTLYVPNLNGDWGDITLPFWDLGSITRQLDTGHFDILHIHQPYVPFLGWQLMYITKLPLVVTFYVGWNSTSPLRIITPLFPLFSHFYARKIHGVLFASNNTYQCWQPLVSPHWITKIINFGISTEYQPGIPAQKSGTKILFVGRLVKKKGAHFLVNAMQEIVRHHPHVTLTIIGIGPKHDHLVAAIKRAGITHSVTMAGYVDHATLIKNYQSADIFCAPYIDEGYGLTIREAMATGCAIVGFQNESFKESLKTYPAQDLLVTSGDTQALTEALERVIVDAKLRQTLQTWGAAESKKYSAVKMVSQTEDLYYAVLSHLEKS